MALAEVGAAVLRNLSWETIQPSAAHCTAAFRAQVGQSPEQSRGSGPPQVCLSWNSGAPSGGRGSNEGKAASRGGSEEPANEWGGVCPGLSTCSVHSPYRLNVISSVRVSIISIVEVL